MTAVLKAHGLHYSKIIHEPTQGLVLPGDFQRDLYGAIEPSLPEYFWMIEASAPELFSASRRKFGEILIRSDLESPRPLDFSLFILARLPGQILTLESNLLNTQPSGTDSHVELFSYKRE